jgi:hypothetical protein
MRNISSASLAKLAANFGTEPINIVEIRWTDDQIAWYADRDLEGIQGKILEIGGLDDVIAVSQNASSAEVDLVLDDTDGSVKEILNTVDIHKRPCFIYQWFSGIPLDEKFIVFQGQISSPITWSESARTVSFTAITRVEDREVGFSPEEGEFPAIPQSLIGQPWPMCFGTVIDLKGIPINEAASATLGEGTGIHDFTIIRQIGALNIQDSYLGDLAFYWFTVEAALRGIGETQGADAAHQNALSAVQAQISVRAQVLELTAALAEQKSWERSPVRVLGAEVFPQNTLTTFNIGEGIFRGRIIGNRLHITAREHPAAADFCSYIGLFHGHSGAQQLVLSATQPLSSLLGDCRILPVAIDRGFGPDTIEGEQAGFFWADGGSQIKLYGREPIDYVISIVPGTVLRVMAYKAVEGTKRLVQVPDSYWSVRSETFGTITAVIVTLNKALSLLTDEGWDDGIFVTFESDVGPNTVDVLEYIINLYLPEFDTDDTSFDYVRDRLENYPSHFALLEKKNVLQVLREIAFQARCAIWISGDTFYLRYLAEEPDTVLDITESDLDTDDGASTFQMYHTPTEDLVTDYTGLWRERYSQEAPVRTILRHNVSKYGTLKREDDYYIYNMKELVIKSMTFWLIRFANTWKKVRFRTAIQTLQVETLDAVNLNFTNDYIAYVPVVSIVEQATFNSNDRTIDYDIWTPVKAGTMYPYDLAYPADITEETIFPTLEEVFAGNAGGGPNSPGFGATGQLQTGWITVNPLRPNPATGHGRNRHDWGDYKPSDLADTPPNVNYAPIDTGPVSNNPQLTTPTYQGVKPPEPQVPFYINLRETNVFDPQTGQSAKFDSFFQAIITSKLVMDSRATIGGPIGGQIGPFDFAYNADFGGFIANQAELKDE